MEFSVKFNYQPSYAEETKYSFLKTIFQNGYCPIHNDVVITKGSFIFKKRNECWRCLQKFNQETELCYTKSQEKETQEKKIQEKEIQEKEVQEKNTNEFKKILNILFRFHYEKAEDTSHLYKSFKCHLCNEECISRENFNVVRLGCRNNAGHKHIKNIIPACLTCHSNWSIHKILFKKRHLRHLFRNISNREKYVYNHKLVSSEEILFIHSRCDIDKLFPIV